MGDLLRREGFEVEYCHLPLWGSDRYSIMGRSKFRLALRALRIYASLAWRLTRTPRPAAYVVLYPGQFDIPVVSTVARVQHVPVLFDMFISMYDTVVQDRKLADPNSAIARLTKFADRVACRFSDLVLVDTPEDAEYFSELTGVGKERFRLLWVGAPEDVFRPLSGVEPETNLVLFYGTFIALQGTDTIVRAAKLLEDDGITIRMIGKGQERPAAEELQRRLGVYQPRVRRPGATGGATRRNRAGSALSGHLRHDTQSESGHSEQGLPMCRSRSTHSDRRHARDSTASETQSRSCLPAIR